VKKKKFILSSYVRRHRLREKTWDARALRLRLQPHAADDTDSWHSDVERSSHELFDYTSDNSMPEDTQDTDVSSIITGYTTHLSSVDGGFKA